MSQSNQDNQHACWTALVLSVAAIVSFCGCFSEPKSNLSVATQSERLPSPPDGSGPTERLIFETTQSEDLVLELSPRLKEFIQKLKQADHNTSSLFNSRVEYLGPHAFDLDAVFADSIPVIDNIRVETIPLEQTTSMVSMDQVWSGVTSQIQFKDAKFGVLSCDIDRKRNSIRMKLQFDGRSSRRGSPVDGVKATQTIVWERSPDSTWKISKWQQHEFQVTRANQTPFQDVTANLVIDESLFKKLSQSSHEEIILRRFRNATEIRSANRFFPRFNDWESSYQYPAVSVVDYDNDGWDDLFVMDRWGPSILLRNEQGKQFVDVTEASGLIVKEYANCALFADFDNDGDQDVFVGRTLKPSLYFRNDGGRFIAEKTVNDQLKSAKFVSAVSAADINRDGRLDLYLSTYCTTFGPREEWIPQVVRQNEIAKFNRILDERNPFLERGGPPNVVLMNRGTTFEQAKLDEVAQQWKNSYQSVWYDVDQDGDQDLYICNDFAPDAFLRNDTPRGSFEPTFVDFTETVFPDGNMGFGMGADFGDFNSDGRIDLYVSNMYSKAGNRVVNQLGGNVDPRIKVSAKGNFLHQQNDDGTYVQVAGVDAEKQRVAKVGWSFGGQMFDLNNDTHLDIYVPSGYFTPPKDLASTTDL